jgi:hypothetical protein
VAPTIESGRFCWISSNVSVRRTHLVDFRALQLRALEHAVEHFEPLCHGALGHGKPLTGPVAAEDGCAGQPHERRDAAFQRCATACTSCASWSRTVSRSSRRIEASVVRFAILIMSRSSASLSTFVSLGFLFTSSLIDSQNSSARDAPRDPLRRAQAAA